MPAKSKKTPEEAAELAAIDAAQVDARRAAQQLILETGWAKLEQAHAHLKSAGRAMILFGVRALQLKSALPYGEFNRQLALHCPQISRPQAYRGMQVTLHLLSEIFQLSHVETTGEALDAHLAGMADCLTGQGDPSMTLALDELIEGKGTRQLVLEARAAKEATVPADEPAAEAWCLTIFETHERGAEFEEKWRADAESGESTWGECKRNIKAAISDRTDLVTPPDEKRVASLLGTGIFRLKSWGAPEHWDLIPEEKRAKLLTQWRELLDNLNPDFRVAAIMRLKGGQS